MNGTTIRVIARGPVVEGKAGPILKQGIQQFLLKMVQIGHDHLDNLLQPRPIGVYLTLEQAGKRNYSRGDYAKTISHTASSSRGIITDGGKKVYGPWLEGTSSRNQTTRFKGYQSFRNTKDWLNKEAEKVGNDQVKLIARNLSG